MIVSIQSLVYKWYELNLRKRDVKIFYASVIPVFLNTVEIHNSLVSMVSVLKKLLTAVNEKLFRYDERLKTGSL